MADLDRYAQPNRDAATLAARRGALLDQLGWLEDEAEALAPLLSALPTWATDQAPMPGDLTAKEVFVLIAATDRDVTSGWIARAQTEDSPVFTTPERPSAEGAIPGADGAANDRPLAELLADLKAARAGLRQSFEAVPAAAWSRPLVLDGTPTDLYGLALAVVQRDAERLKELAYRLHEADLRPRTPADVSASRPGGDLPRPPSA